MSQPTNQGTSASWSLEKDVLALVSDKLLYTCRPIVSKAECASYHPLCSYFSLIPGHHAVKICTNCLGFGFDAGTSSVCRLMDKFDYCDFFAQNLVADQFAVRAKLHYTDTAATNTSYGHRLRTPPTDKNSPHPNILTCRDVGLGIAMWQICCRIVVSSSVGGVRWWCCTCP